MMRTSFSMHSTCHSLRCLTVAAILLFFFDKKKKQHVIICLRTPKFVDRPVSPFCSPKRGKLIHP